MTYLRGKTADEAAELSNKLWQQTLVPQMGQPGTTFGGPNMMPYQQPQYQAPPPPQPQQPTQDEWMADPSAAYQKQRAYEQATQFEPYVQQQAQQLSQTNRMLAEMRYSREFQRWGPEIDLMMQQIPHNQRTAQAYDFIVGHVRGNHADELATEKAEEILKQRLQAGEVVRPQAGTSTAPSVTDETRIDLNDESLPVWWREACQKAGIKPRDVDDFLMKTKFYGVDLSKARERYLKALKDGGAVEGVA